MQMSMFSLEEHRANPSQSRDFEKVWLTLAGTSLSPSLQSLLDILPVTSSGKMSLACCQANMEGILEPSSGAWGNAGMGGLTGFSMPNISEFHSAAAASSLSDILETGEVPQRFYLSATACRGILRRAEKRGRALPPSLQMALERVAQTTTRDKQDTWSMTPDLLASLPLISKIVLTAAMVMTLVGVGMMAVAAIIAAFRR